MATVAVGVLTGGLGLGLGVVAQGAAIGFTYGIGSGTNSFAGRALAHGALNSFMTRARGGRWNSGFWAGFAGTMLSPVVSSARGYYAKIAANAFVAGTVSQITGDKFANGAWSGAFRFMFNEAMHKEHTYFELEKGYSFTSNQFVQISQSQYDSIASMFKANADTWYYTHTCVDYARDVYYKATGVYLDVDDYFGFETPRELAKSIGN